MQPAKSNTAVTLSIGSTNRHNCVPSLLALLIAASAQSAEVYVCSNVAGLDRNYVSTMLTLSVKDLEWHKGKKTRHRRRLSLLPQVLVSSQSHSSAESCERLSNKASCVVLCAGIAQWPLQMK